MVEKKLYTPKETCQIFSISRPTLNDWCKRNVLSKIAIPNRRRVFITGESIDRLINQQPK